MKLQLLELLQCPNCGQRVSLNSVASCAETNEVEYGFLVCGCAQYPIVAGIPIFKTHGRVSVMRHTVDAVLNVGPKVEELVSLIRSGSCQEALLRLLVIPNRGARICLELSDAGPKRIRNLMEKTAQSIWSRQKRRESNSILAAKEDKSGLEMIRFFYQASLKQEVYHYFSCRFGQPRHLAALALATLFKHSAHPVLDLACGFGHLMHFLLNAQPGQRVIGLDRNFFQLYVAKNWIAPGGDFVCAEADHRLPFVSGVFGGVFCSDAFHCFLRRIVCAQEMIRTTDEAGLIAIARAGNSLVEPREGYEMTPAQYVSLFERLATRIVSEEELLDGYLKRTGPQLRQSGNFEKLAGEKWLSLVAAKQAHLLGDSGQFATWPHAVGALRLNPLYQQNGINGEDPVSLSLRFPSEWYEFENSGCLRYMPQTATISRAELNKIEAGGMVDSLEALISQCVVIGMPQRYL